MRASPFLHYPLVADLPPEHSRAEPLNSAAGRRARTVSRPSPQPSADAASIAAARRRGKATCARRGEVAQPARQADERDTHTVGEILTQQRRRIRSVPDPAPSRWTYYSSMHVERDE